MQHTPFLRGPPMAVTSANMNIIMIEPKGDDGPAGYIIGARLLSSVVFRHGPARAHVADQSGIAHHGTSAAREKAWSRE